MSDIETIESVEPRGGPDHEASGIVQVQDLEKIYSTRKVKAVAGVSFSVRAGEVFGLLGPNGAGKTTTIGILTTRILPTAGKAFVSSIDVVRDPVSVKPHIAVVPQRSNLDRSLTAIENLTFHAAYFGMSHRDRRERALRLLSQFGLAKRTDDKIITYSGGMAQRLLIARALMHDPEILFLDEPTAGLDPQSRLFLWDIIRDLNGKGLTVILTTHDMEEAEKLCGRVAIMDHGKILALDTPRKLSQVVPSGTRVELKTRNKDGQAPSAEVMTSVLSRVRELPGVTSADWVLASGAASSDASFPGNDGALRAMAMSGKMPSQSSAPTAAPADDEGGPMLRFYSEGGGDVAVGAAWILLDAGIELADMHLYRASLEDVFIHLTGKGLRN